MRGPRPVLLVGIVLAAVTAAGCGSGSSGTPDNPKTELTASMDNLTGGDDHFALRKVSRFTEPTHPLDLQRIELGKHLVTSAFKDRRWW